jgi:hypothetical protein|tara:strand:+ start:3448 stop:4086 length:639 start_codon:yes stop_codon:yes gene_type:complete
MANLKTISQFKSRLQGGGARPNLFEVNINDFKFSEWDNETFQFLCKAAQLPSSNVTPIEVPFRGRSLKVAGDRTFDEWTVSIINDEDFRLRTSFENWMNGISKLSDASGATNPNSYMGNAVVNQLGRGYNQGRFSTNNSGDGNNAGGETGVAPLRSYYFDGIFPTNISPIDLSYESSDVIEEYTVTFQVQYWIAGTNSTNGSPSDQNGTVIV